MQDYLNLDHTELDALNLIKASSMDAMNLLNAMKKCVLSLKGFWKCWGDNISKDYTSLTADDFEEYLITDSGPQVMATSPHGPPTTHAPTTGRTTSTDVTTITTAVSATMLAMLKSKSGQDRETVGLRFRCEVC